MRECSLNIFLCCLLFSTPNCNHLILFFSLCISLTHYFSQSFDTCRYSEQIPETLCPSFLLTQNPHASTHRSFSAHCMHGQSDVTKSALQAIKRLFITVSDIYILFLLSENGLEVVCKDVNVVQWKGCCVLGSVLETTLPGSVLSAGMLPLMLM